MSRIMPGLHHVTALCGAPQANVDFYVGVLGQRLVKKTVNFDAPDTYHLYYGDAAGSPGTILTFFPFVNAGTGRAGAGMASAVAYTVPAGGLDAWMAHLAGKAVDFDGPFDRFGRATISVVDPDGLRIDLVEAASGVSAAAGQAGDDAAPADDGFHSVTLWLADPAPTGRLLVDLFGYESAGEARDGGFVRQRLVSPAHGRGATIDLVRHDDRSAGRQGAGSIHHVAFRAESNEIQLEWQERVRAAGLDVTPVIDRQYFNAIYFREPGGVLFEIATDPPGFATDEPKDQLGRHLMLPPQYEARRGDIERILPPIRVPG